jgi:CPA1 family monovalent cation:H+ antiporter
MAKGEGLMEQFIYTETLVIELLLIVSLVAMAVRRLRIPYTVALVIAGLIMTFRQPVVIDLTPELILALFVPPLVFEAAFHLSVTELQHNLVSILILAVPGVILTMLIVGGLVALGASLSLPVALVFGALIAATDPVAVIALFRALGVPRRLGVLLEGESLLNDGTAIVIFNLVLVSALTGQFSLVRGIVGFIQVAGGGVFIGLVLGWIVSQLIAHVDDYLIETTLTTVLAFGSYLVAEQLHFSGVLSVVAAGLVNGNIGPKGMSPTTRIVLFNFWEYVAFLVNSLVFLLLGLQVNLVALMAAWQQIVCAIVAVLIARAVVVYGLGWFANRLTERVPIRWQHVLMWGGLRGAISLALALSLPAALGSDRDTLRVMTFGVVLFNLLVQGTTMKPLLGRLGLLARDEQQQQYELRHARLVAIRAAKEHLAHIYRQGLLSAHTHEVLEPELAKLADSLSDAMRELLRASPSLEAQELDQARRELLHAQRSALLDLRNDGLISDAIFDQLITEVDTALVQDQVTLPGNSSPPSGDHE